MSLDFTNKTKKQQRTFANREISGCVSRLAALLRFCSVIQMLLLEPALSVQPLSRPQRKEGDRLMELAIHFAAEHTCCNLEKESYKTVCVPHPSPLT
jgi:hypothetical protein